jgi:hypothetical protein
MFLIAIEVEQEDDDTENYLQLRGENSAHLIDLETFRNTSAGKITQNIRLSQDGSGSGFFCGLGAACSSLGWCSSRPCFEPCRGSGHAPRAGGVSGLS